MGARFRFNQIIPATLAILVGVTAAAFAQGKAENPHLRVHVYPGNVVSLYAQLGAKKGFYKDAGLNVELVQIGTGPQASAALVGRSVDVVLNTPDNMIALKARAVNPVAIVGNLVQPLFVLVAQDKTAFPSQAKGYPAIMQDLSGRNVGVYGLGGASDRFVKMLLRDAGKPDNSVQFVALGGPAQSMAALTSKRVDVIAEVFMAAIAAELGGVGFTLLDCSKMACAKSVAVAGKIGQAYWTTDQIAQDKEGALRAFRNAHQRIDAWVKDPANDSALRDELKSLLPTPQNVDAAKYIAAVTQEIKNYFGTALDPAALEATNEAMVATGELKAPISTAGMIWSGTSK